MDRVADGMKRARDFQSSLRDERMVDMPNRGLKALSLLTYAVRTAPS